MTAEPQPPLALGLDFMGVAHAYWVRPHVRGVSLCSSVNRTTFVAIDDPDGVTFATCLACIATMDTFQ